VTSKRILLAVAICAGGLLIRQELRSGRQVEPLTAAAPARAPEHRPAELDLATIPRPAPGWDCEAMWRDGQTEQAQAFQKQGLCRPGFDCWTNRAHETVCGTHEAADVRAVRELEDSLKRKR
jgi:hypothetical protein